MKPMRILMMLMVAWGATAQIPAPEAAAQVDRVNVADVTDLPFSRKLEVPYLSLYYLKPVIAPEEKLAVKFYVTDWHQSEVRFRDPSLRFTVTLTVDGPGNLSFTRVLKDIPPGDHTFLCEERLDTGDYRLAVAAVDQQGRRAPVMFQEFRVRTLAEQQISNEQICIMTAADLAKYEISRTGDYGVFHFIDATGKKVDETSALVEEAAQSVIVPDGKYVVVVGGEQAPAGLIGTIDTCGAYNLPAPDRIPNSWSWRSCKVLYSPSYDKEKVAAEAVATGNGLNRLMQDVRANGKRKLVLLPGTYRISHKTSLKIPSGLTLDLNGATIKLDPFTGCKGVIISITHGIDSHLINGIVEGDYFEHDYTNSTNNSEWVLGISISGDSRYCSFRNLVVRYITGYGVCNGFEEAFAGAKHFKSFTPGTLDRQTGAEVAENGLYLSDWVPIAEFRKKAGYITASRYLGYQGRAFDGWNVLYHFYDKEKRYLKTVDGWQYRRTRIPAHADYLRVTVWSKRPPKESTLTANLFKVPWNCTFENIYIQNARCVGMAPSAMFNQKIANCTLVRSGENLANCAFDAEDGWDMMQDVWICRNRFLMNTLNDLLTCAGHNFVIERNEGNLHLWSRTAGYVVRSNAFKNAYYGYGGRERTLLPRIDGNSYSGRIEFGDNGEDLIMERMQAFMQGREGKVFDGAWFLMPSERKWKDQQLLCNANAACVGVELENVHQMSRLNLLYSILRNTTFHALGHSRFLNSILEGVTGTVYQAKLPIIGCHLKNVSLNLSNGSDLLIENSTLEDIEFSHGYWIKPANVTLLNCVVKNRTGKPLLRTPSYSIGVFKFVNCMIDTGAAPVVELYDLRAQPTDTAPGTVRFENSTVINNSGFMVMLGKYANNPAENSKPLAFEVVGSPFTGEVVQWPSTAWKITLSNNVTLNKIHRGWDEKTEKRIRDWLNR